jgi:hypothetical protein
MLATFLDEPEPVTPAQMDRWCREAPGAGMYRTTYYARCDVAGTAGQITVRIKWYDGSAQEETRALGLQTAGIQVHGEVQLYSAAAQDIKYQVDATGILGMPKYSLRLRAERIPVTAP